MENTLIENSDYEFTSNFGKKCIGKYIGRDNDFNILMKIDGKHSFKINENGIAVFNLSHYFFFRYFKPVLIDLKTVN